MFTQQVHGDRIIYAESGSVIEKEPEADGLYTDKKGVLLAIQTADCVPVLFFSENGNVVGAAHAGWKGAKLNILDRLYEKLSTKAKDFSAIICPSIQQKSYEVDSIFYGNFLEEDSGNDEFFIPSKKPMHFMFDLPTYVKRKLEKLLLKNIYHINEDTYSMKLPDDSFKYPSYRRSCHTGEFYPRSLVSTIMIKE
jgi:YfiH family protein